MKNNFTPVSLGEIRHRSRGGRSPPSPTRELAGGLVPAAVKVGAADAFVAGYAEHEADPSPCCDPAHHFASSPVAQVLGSSVAACLPDLGSKGNFVGRPFRVSRFQPT